MKYSVSVYNRYRKPILTDVKVDTWEEALAVIKDTLNNAPFVIQEIGESEGGENLKASELKEKIMIEYKKIKYDEKRIILYQNELILLCLS